MSGEQRVSQRGDKLRIARSSGNDAGETINARKIPVALIQIEVGFDFIVEDHPKGGNVTIDYDEKHS